MKILNHLEGLKKMATGELPGSPAAQVLDFHVTEVEEGRVVVEMEATDRLHNPMGTLHGGILCDIADAAMGYAFATTLADDELFSTVEIKLNFLKPIFKTRLRAEGTLIKKGGSVGLLECHIYDEKQSLVGHSTSTCMVLKGNASKKRIQST
ncbi:PaaI family thioesterase [Peribacillus sp. NPDC097295]|uniref:PaaI family thioesterase n=1 Tax=Peribacillus sp. NPDC097295 TaxID=3364402 RepID=UPI00382DCC17